MNRSVSLKSRISIAIKLIVAYAVLYFGLLGFCPPAYMLYLKIFESYEDLMPSTAPKQITDAKEFFDVHSFNEAKKFFGEEIIIFRNYSNCADNFEKIIYPRRKDQIDEYLGVEMKPYQGNVYVPGAELTNETLKKSLKDLLDEASPDYYASFLRIFKPDDFQVMLNTDNETRFGIDSSFISHFKNNIVSTPIHSAPFVDTFSVQCYGTKSWLFTHVRDLKKYGFIPQVNPHGVIINGSPDSIVRIPTIRAIVNPGDVMYFPPFYFHAVASSAGKNIMFAIRAPSIASIKRSFKTSMNLSTLFIIRRMYTRYYNKYINKSKRRGFFSSKDYVPFKSQFMDNIIPRQFEKFKEYEGISDFQLPIKG